MLILLLISLVAANPVIFWGNSFEKQASESFAHLSPEELVKTVVSLAQNTQVESSKVAAHVTKKHAAPQVVVVYSRSFGGSSHFYDELEDHKVAGPLKFLNQVIEGVHGGSVVLPYVQTEGTVYEMLVEPLVERLEGADVLFTGESNKAYLPHFYKVGEICQQVKASSSKVPQVLVVDLDGLDKGLEEVDSCVFEKTGGKYLAVFASGEAEAVHVQARSQPAPVAQQQEQMHFHATRNTGENATATRPPTYFPSYVWGWLLVVIFLVTFFIIGAKSIAQVQVPPKLLSADAVNHRKNK